MAELNFLSKSLDKILGSVWGRLFIVALQTVLSSLVLLFLFTLRQSGDITLLKYVIVLGIGFIAGSSARSFLKGFSQVLKLLAAIVSSSLSLIILNTLSGGFLGINLFNQLFKKPDWSGLIQIGLAAVGALLVLLAFGPTSMIKDIPARRPWTPRPSSRLARNQARSKLNIPAAKKTRRKSTGAASAKEAPLSVKKTKTKKEAPLAVAKTKTRKKGAAAQKLSLARSSSRGSKTKKLTRPNTKRLKKKKDIRFTGVEEHSCPYCLDPVEPHDPRGVKICPICKTHHHKDCWGITGACQIPHSNNK